jgi:predicted NAD-dependent protein-ADP-ribosyltransferase YbiA (DUF1768 family)
MYSLEYILARAVMEDRIREANQHRLARAVTRQEQPTTAAPAGRTVRRLSRVWSLVHLRQAHSG